MKTYLSTKSASSEDIGYEAEKVCKCLQEERKESAILPLKETQLVASIMDEVMKQLSVVYYNQ